MSHPVDPPSVTFWKEISLRQSHCSLWFQYRKVLTTLVLARPQTAFFAPAGKMAKVVWTRSGVTPLILRAPNTQQLGLVVGRPIFAISPQETISEGQKS